MDQQPPTIRIARAGTFTSMQGIEVTFTPADFAGAVAAYDAEGDPAPLVVGHPALDDPAYGWVSALKVEDGALVAQADRIEPAFAELVRTGRFGKISPAFYPPEHPANPKPGAWYLKHVGFLGAHAPAIKGLGTVRLADGEADPVIFEFAAAAALPPQQRRENTMSEVNLAEREAALAAREQDLGTREAGIAAREEADRAKAAQARSEANAAFAEGLVSQAKLAPAGKPLVVGLLAALDASAVAAFGEAGEMTPTDALRKLLESGGTLIDLGERGAKPAGENSYTSFAAPDGYTADPAQADLYARARKIQGDKPELDWMACVKLAQTGN